MHMDPDVVNDPRYKDKIDDALKDIPSVCINTDLGKPLRSGFRHLRQSHSAAAGNGNGRPPSS